MRPAPLDRDVACCGRVSIWSRIAAMGEPGPFVRGDVEACALCGQDDAPYVYLQDQQHYCIRCARRKLVTEQIRPAGLRADDLTMEDVLFRELPDPRIPGDGATDPGDAEG